MAFGDVEGNIYTEFFTTLENHATFAYFKTKQRGFLPLTDNLFAPSLYPWVFIEYGGEAEIDAYAAPRVWQHQFVIACVAMTFADRGDPTNLVFNDGSSDNKGIGDIAADIKYVFWTTKKENHFAVSGVKDWTIGRIGTPNILGVMAMLTNPFVRGVQLDFVFKIEERT